MRAPLSIIIPTYNSAANLAPTLASVFEAVESGLLAELIVVDGGSADDIRTLADSVGARLINAPKGRGSQLAAGADAAMGAWLLFLHSDTVLSGGWPIIAQQHMQTSQGAGYFKLRFDAAGLAPRFVAGWANLRARFLGLPYGDQGLLIPASLYQQVGGYPKIPLMEDVALARALTGKLHPLTITATTSAARYQKDGWLARGWRNLTTLCLYLIGVAPEKLVKRYQNHRQNR